jgi:threonine dehydratase
VEPAGALAAAGLKSYCARHPKMRGRNIVALTCGANMNFDRLRFVAERAELGEAREALIAATIPERPGSFRRFCELLGRRGITEFNYRISDAKRAHVFAGVEISHAGEAAKIIAALRKDGVGALDLSANEMAKLHIRHMVGGRAKQATDERLYRFEFPERPGALLNFLSKMSGGWNISLFHYRNHGADYGRVLAGVQVPDDEMSAFQKYLDALGYPYHREGDNPAYRMFLARPD